MGHAQQVEEFYISPNVAKQLRRGEAGLVIKHPAFYVDVGAARLPAAEGARGVHATLGVTAGGTRPRR